MSIKNNYMFYICSFRLEHSQFMTRCLYKNESKTFSLLILACLTDNFVDSEKKKGSFSQNKKTSREGFTILAEEENEYVYVCACVQETSYFNLIVHQKNVYMFLYTVNHSHSLCLIYFNRFLLPNIIVANKYKR